MLGDLIVRNITDIIDTNIDIRAVADLNGKFFYFMKFVIRFALLVLKADMLQVSVAG